jgi:hypothetical protein
VTRAVCPAAKSVHHRGAALGKFAKSNAREGRHGFRNAALLMPVIMAVPLILVVGVGVGAGAAAEPDATLAAAQSMEAKLRILQSEDVRPASSYPAVVVTEHEANSYLKIHSPEFLPPGVHGPALRFQPERVTGSADVNFDEFSRVYTNPNDWGPKVMAAMFKGTQRVTATGKVQSSNGQATVQVESVTVGPMTVPVWLVDYLIQNYLQPKYKFDLSKPLPLPAHVRQIVLGSGQATFLRGSDKAH